MKFSINNANDFSNVDLKSIPHDEIVQRMGAQLGAIEDTKEWSTYFKDTVIAKVISCEKHPNADKLNLCMIDDGGVTDVERNDEGLVQVVCGANNVTAGIYVAWIPPGATVPSTYDSDPFVLEARHLRGKISNGMIASPRELNISDEHDGILIIEDSEAKHQPVPGEQFSSYFGLDDFIITCENKMFTHRPDCFGNLGIAREVAGIFGLQFKSPEWYTEMPVFKNVTNHSLSVENNIQDVVPRFTVVSMDSLINTKSPTWLQSYLKRVDIKPINTIVDVTNYVMHVSGQPLHAFDYHKIEKLSENPGIRPRRAKKGEKITILGGKELLLHEEDIVIATDKEAVALAGVMGGAATEVDEDTKAIIIECANFDMYAIRRTSMRHGLFTEAVTRFNKGQSPLQNDRVLSYTMQLLSKLTGAKQASPVYDITSFDKDADNLNVVKTQASFINARLGSDLSSTDIQMLLENVEFVVKIQGDDIEITAPFWRMDIAIPEDIVEEVGRLYGYDKLPVVLPKRSSKPTPKNKSREFKQEIRTILATSGANELLTYSFVHGKLLENTGIDPDKWAYHLRNALSPELQYYRPSLIPSLLSKVHGNIKATTGNKTNIIALFEFGKAHVKEHFDEDEPSLPKQMNRLSFVIAADNKSANSLGQSAYYHAKKYVELITNQEVSYEALDTNEYPLTSPYQKERSAVITIGPDKQPIGVVGEFRKKVTNSLKLPNYCSGFEIDVDLLFSHKTSKIYEPLSQFPSTTQDITFEISTAHSWADLYTLIHAELAVAKAELGYSYQLEPLDIFQAESVSDKKRISFRITFTHHHKTLKTQEINETLEQLAKAVHEELQAVRI
jgi:phenylalanyl-tRNA synthetase beta chain